MNTTLIAANAAARRRRGFTLLEMMIALSIMSLVFLGAMFLMDSSARATVRTQAQIYATGDAANSLQGVIGLMREAQGFTLPLSQTTGQPESGWIVPSGTTSSQFTATLNGQTVATAVEILAPPGLTPSTNGYKAGVSDISVQSTTGAALPLNPLKAPYASTPYSSQTAGTVVTLIYRGDPDGTPDPDPTGSAVAGAGTFLWRYALPANGTFNPAVNPPTQLCKSLSASPNSAQFVRPTYAGVPEPNQIEIKVISGYYSPIQGQQTNEEGNGASSSQLVGKCVYMRDHQPAAKAPTNATRTSNNTFQYH